ncbi:MAG: magnesium transporter CorA family protein [Clostridiaceae bacterium]|nr:magnesium transporter CorA family protein [Clostridiaceae bacterium]
MLEIFYSHIRSVNGRTVYDLESIDQIRDDCWVNLYAPTEDELKRVEKELDLPPEFLRYALDEEERPRIDLDDDGSTQLIIADFPYIRRDGPQAKYETQPMGIILSAKCLVTVSLREASVLDPFRNNRVRDFVTGFRTRFTFQIMYAGAKDYLKFLRYMDKTIDSAEHQLSKSISNRELFKLMELGKSLIYFSTSLKSNEAVLEKLMRSRFIKQYEEDSELLEDVLIEYKQALEMANIYTSIINGTMDAYASIISNNLNVVMKFMAAMTIVLSIPNIFTSFFGQNIPLPFDGSAFAGNPWPFIIILGLCIGSVALTIWLLNRRDMF